MEPGVRPTRQQTTRQATIENNQPRSNNQVKETRRMGQFNLAGQADGRGESYLSAEHGYILDGDGHKGTVRWLNGNFWEGTYSATIDPIDNYYQRYEPPYFFDRGTMTFVETGNTLQGEKWDASFLNMEYAIMWIKAENREVEGDWIDGRFREREGAAFHHGRWLAFAESFLPGKRRKTTSGETESEKQQ